MNETVTAQQSTWRYILRLRRLNARLARRVHRLTRDLAQARHCAHHDTLTGLPNRSLLMDRLAQATAQSARYGKPVMLLVVDLDGFKRINDGFGHYSGDELLQQVAARLLDCVRSCDTVCRYGGDEFVIMLPQIAGATGADIVSEKIKARLAAPYMLDGRSIAVTASIGAAVCCGHSPSELIDVADAAMYVEKSQRRASAGDVPWNTLYSPRPSEPRRTEAKSNMRSRTNRTREVGYSRVEYAAGTAEENECESTSDRTALAAVSGQAEAAVGKVTQP